MSLPAGVLGTALFAVLLLPTSAVAQQPLPSAATVASRVDALVRAALAEPSGPASVGVMIARGGDTLVHRAWGVADASSGRPVSESSTYQLASTSKQFTAALVLKLIDRGRLSLDDTLGAHLTGLRPEWRPLTIEQLLNHTSGLQREYRQHLDASHRAVSQPGDTLLAWATRDSMAFAPGTRWSYSNTGYMLLGLLVEKLYGKPYGDVLHDEIARPLDLATLGWCTAPEKRAAETSGHTRSEQGALQPAERWNTDLALGAGGLCASAGDLARWSLALHGGRVLSPASYAAMITPRGAATSEGYGFGIRSQRAPWGSTYLGHSGGSSGFAAMVWWFPAESLTVSVVQNTLPSAPLFPSVALIALGRTPRAAATASVQAPKEAPASTGAPAGTGTPVGPEAFVGFYEGRPGVGLTVTLDDGTLYAAYGPASRVDRKNRLVLKSGTVYHVGGDGAPETVTFTVAPDGRVTEVVLRQGNGRGRALRKAR